MGGTTSHAFAVLLKEAKNMPQQIRCVGFGCPRPGSSKLRHWAKEHLTSDSMNIVLAREEHLNSNDRSIDQQEHQITAKGEFNMKSPQCRSRSTCSTSRYQFLFKCFELLCLH